MKAVLNILVLLIPFSVLASNQETDSLVAISGKIITIDGQAAGYVSVHLKNSSKGTVSDQNGNFEFRKIKPGIYLLSASLLGYNSTETMIEVKQNETTYIKIQLEITYAALLEVIVQSNAKSKYIETRPSEGLKVNLPLAEIPQNIIVTTHPLLADQGLLSMTEAIRNVSGVQKISGGLNDYTLNIRGTDATFNVSRNGLPGYWWNQQEDAAMIEKIEIIKGPAAFMISNAQPGGFVNIVTKQPAKERIANINAAFGSFNTMRLTTDIGGPVNKKEKLSYRFNSGIHRQQRAFQFSKASRYFFCAAVMYEPGAKTSVTAEYNYMRGRTSGNNNGLPSINGELFSLPRNFTVADENSDRLTAVDKYYRLQLKHNFSDKWRLSTQIAFVHGNWTGNLLNADADIPVSNDTLYRYSSFDDWRTYSGVIQAHIDGKFYTGDKIEHKILAGIDLCHAGFKGIYGETRGQKKFGLYLPQPQHYIHPDSLKDFTISPLFKETHGWAALHLQDHIKIVRKLVVTLAGRFTHFFHNINNIIGDPTAADYEKHVMINTVTPRAGLTWLFSDNVSLYVLYDKSFWPQLAKNFENKPFKPLTGYNLESGVKGFLSNKKINYNFSLFHIVKNNTLTPDPQHINYFIQRGQVISNGIDFDMTGSIGPALTLNANYEYVDAKTTKDSDPAVVGVKNLGTPAHSGNLWLKYDWRKGKLKGFSFAAGYQYMGKQSAVWYYNPDPDTRFFPAYHLLDAALSYSNRKLNISLNVYNITNSNYAANGFYSQLNEWRYTPGEPVNFRLSFGISLLGNKKDQ
jgi:iron complex outermembrane receptor protein